MVCFETSVTTNWISWTGKRQW